METEDQGPVFACEGCRDHRTVEEQDLRVETDGSCWCVNCYTEDHTWEEWEELKPFKPAFRRDLARKDAEIAELDTVARLLKSENDHLMATNRFCEVENQRLRAALERCRLEFRHREEGGSPLFHTSNIAMLKLCAEALEGK